MKPLKVVVSTRHIRGGVKGSTDSCPIALAIKEALITESVTVNASTMLVNGKLFDLNEGERKFVRDFDAGRCRRKLFTLYLERI